MSAFSDDPVRPGVRSWRRSPAGRAGAILAMLVIGAIALGCVGLGLWIMAAGISAGPAPGLGIFLGLAGAFMGMLAWYAGRAAIGSGRFAIAISDMGIDLRLPRMRSLIHRPPRFEGRIAWSALAGMTTRLEAYRSQGLGVVQRTWWLRKNDGSTILLFSELASGADQGLAELAMTPLAREISTRGALAIIELPMAEGKGGLLGAWFTRPPAMDAAPIGQAGRQRVARAIGRMGWITRALILIVAFLALVRFASTFFG